MLTLYRRHLRTCPHHAKPNWMRCECPVWCRGRVGNRPIRQSLNTNSVERARRRMDELERQIEEHREAKNVADAVEQFLAAKSIRNSTRRRYARSLNPLATFSEARKIESLDAITLEDLDRYKITRKVSAFTWSKELETLRSFFRFALKRRWCTANPAADLESPRNVNPRPRKPYTSEEIADIIAAAGTFGRTAYERARARAMILLMNNYALRVSDVATLQRDRIRSGQLFLYAHKNDNPVWAPLYPEVQEALEVLPLPTGADENCPWFFWTGKGDVDGHIKTVDRTLQAVFRKSGVAGASAHRFRHTLAVRILTTGGTIEDAANVLGDSPEVVRKHYLPWCSAFQQRVTDALKRAHQGGIGTPEVHEKNLPVSALESRRKVVLEVGVEPTCP